MKKRSFFNLMAAVAFTIVNCSTNEVYGAFIAREVSAFAALAVFSFFAFLATYGVIYRNQTRAERKGGLFSPAQTIHAHICQVDGRGKAFIFSLIVAYVVYFYSLLVSLKAADAFTIVLVGCLGSLLNVAFSMWIFKDKVERYTAFYMGLLIALAGIVLYGGLAGTSLVKDGYTLMDVLLPIGVQVLTGLYSDLVKTKLRRSYGLNPELLTVMPFAAATLFGLGMFLYQGGVAPSVAQVLILLYIGVFPTALFNIYSQHLKDSIGIPLVALIQLPRPLYILVAQGVLLSLAPIFALVPGLHGQFTNPMNQPPIAMVCMAIILFGVFLGNYYGKPLKPDFK